MWSWRQLWVEDESGVELPAERRQQTREVGGNLDRRWKSLGLALITAVILFATEGCALGGEHSVREPPDRAVSPVFYVNMYDEARPGYDDGYKIGRYSGGRPAPVGPVATGEQSERRQCGGVVWPSATQKRRSVFLYATEWACDGGRWDRLVAFTSTDGRSFARRRVVLQRRPGDSAFGFAFVVYDQRLFRAWWIAVRGGNGITVKRGQADLLYAESDDGLHFHQVGGVKAHIEQLDFLTRHRGRWYLFHTVERNKGDYAPALVTFTNPRQAHYRQAGFIGTTRQLSTTLTESAAAGDTTLAVGSTAGFRTGDLIVLSSVRGFVSEPKTVTAVRPGRLVVQPLDAAHAAGETVATADARKVAPSYVCRNANGVWGGIFTVYEAVPRTLLEMTLAYRAPSPRGPWRIDYRFPAPLFPMWNGAKKRSVENPTPLLRSPEVQRCSSPQAFRR